MSLQVLAGDRIGRLGKIRLGCSAAIFDATGTRILLTKRADNGEWCLPGGIVESGETVEETCIREVLEETGLHIRITQLVGVYSNPHLLVEYPGGNRFQQVSLCFTGEVVDGQLAINEESTEYGFYTFDETQHMKIIATSSKRIEDAFTHRPQAFIR